MDDRHYLNVPYKEKDVAKTLGAVFDYDGARRWYVPAGVDLVPFKKWMPEGAASLPSLRQGRPATELVPAAPPRLDLARPESAGTGTGTGTGAELRAAAKGIPLSRLLGGVATAVSQAFATGVWTMVEVMNVKLSNGHVFLELAERTADTGHVVAKASATIWATTAGRILPVFERATGVSLAAGIKLLVRAKPSFKPQFGLSLEIDAIDSDYTLGDLEAKKKEVRARLQAEGVFDRNKQLPAPWDFKLVVVVAPHEAAGLGDFRKESDRLAAAGLCRFIHVHSRFQGEGAPREIVAALTAGMAECAAAGELPDALVVIRGGGAVNDLAWLNDYALARFICDQQVPVLTGIGHERDNTLADEVAHSRFDTPSKVIAAIEQRIAARAGKAKEAWEAITSLAARALRDARVGVEQAHAGVGADARDTVARARQGAGDAMSAIKVQALQDVSDASRRALAAVTEVRSLATHQVSTARLRVPERLAEIQAMAIAKVGAARATTDIARATIHERAGALSQRARTQTHTQMAAIGERAEGAVSRARKGAQSLMREIAGQGPSKTLNRGFAIVRAEDGTTITSVHQAANTRLEIQFRDGSMGARVTTPCEQTPSDETK